MVQVIIWQAIIWQASVCIASSNMMIVFNQQGNHRGIIIFNNSCTESFAADAQLSKIIQFGS